VLPSKSRTVRDSRREEKDTRKVWIRRLEKVGMLPRRIQLGPNRVGWVGDEVLGWLRARLDRREDLTQGTVKKCPYPNSISSCRVTKLTAILTLDVRNSRVVTTKSL